MISISIPYQAIIMRNNNKYPDLSFHSSSPFENSNNIGLFTFYKQEDLNTPFPLEQPQ